MDRYFASTAPGARARPGSVHGPAAAIHPGEAGGALQHGGPRHPDRGLRQRRQPPARPGIPRHVAGRVARGSRRTRSPSATSPTASTRNPGSRTICGMLYDRYLGPRWAEEPGRHDASGRACEQIPGEELWRTHERRRERLVAFARRRLASQLRGARRQPSRSSRRPRRCSTPRRSRIGFARRFATYKRGTPAPSRPGAVGADPQRSRDDRCRSSSPARRTPRTSRARL